MRLSLNPRTTSSRENFLSQKRSAIVESKTRNSETSSHGDDLCHEGHGEEDDEEVEDEQTEDFS